jgi:mRNA-degrading endonuclease RelE of RelBE toxin-antitoxin system
VDEVYVEKAVESDIKRVPTTTFHRIVSQIKTLAENPRPSGCRKLTGVLSGLGEQLSSYLLACVC